MAKIKINLVQVFFYNSQLKIVGPKLQNTFVFHKLWHRLDISSNKRPWCLLNFETVRCGAYLRPGAYWRKYGKTFRSNFSLLYLKEVFLWINQKQMLIMTKMMTALKVLLHQQIHTCLLQQNRKLYLLSISRWKIYS